MDKSPDISPSIKKWFGFGNHKPSTSPKTFEFTLSCGTKISIIGSQKQDTSSYFQINRITNEIYTISTIEVVIPHKFTYELASSGYEGRYYSYENSKFVFHEDYPSDKNRFLIYSRGWCKSAPPHQKFPIYVSIKPREHTDKEFIEKYKHILELFHFTS